MNFGVEIQGERELIADLARAAEAVNPKAVTEVLTDGARFIAQEAKQRAPRGTDSKRPGLLKQSIVYRPFSIQGNRRPGAIAITLVGRPNSAQAKAPHAHLVEFGTKPHVIIPRKRGGALQLRGGKIREWVAHPGAKPKPFFRPAVVWMLPLVTANVTNRLTRIVERAATGR